MKDSKIQWINSQLIGWIVILIALLGVFYWGKQYTKTKEIRIATASKGGFYYKFGKILKKHIEKQTDLKVELLVTKGSVENRKLLLSGKADLAIIQSGAVAMDNLAAVNPLWEDFVQIIIRKNSEIKTVRDLINKNVAIGKKGSGYRVNAKKVLEHFAISTETLGKNTAYFKKMLTDQTISASIVTTNLLNPDLKLVMNSGKFSILPIEEAEGLAFHYPFFNMTVLPQGVFSSINEPLPEKQVTTISTTAILATRMDTPHAVINVILNTINTFSFRTEVPVLLNLNEVKGNLWSLLPAHPAVESYYNPYSGITIISGIIEFISRFIVIIILVLIIICVASYKLIVRNRVLEEIQYKTETQHLESWISEITKIEEKQQNIKDLRVLTQCLNDAIRAKNQAIRDTKGKKVQHSILFLAFLQECAHIIREIEWRISLK